MAAKLRKACAVCTPQCIRRCPIVEQRNRFRRRLSCPSCGAFVQAGDEECAACGTPIESICPDCLSVNAISGDVCSACGFSNRYVDHGPSPWYRYKNDDQRGLLAPPPGQPR